MSTSGLYRLKARCERGFKRNQSRSAILWPLFVVTGISSTFQGGIVLLSGEGQGRSAPPGYVFKSRGRRGETRVLLDAGVYSASSRAGKTRRAWLSRLFPFIFVRIACAPRSDNCRGSCKSHIVFSVPGTVVPSPSNGVRKFFDCPFVESREND